jgi:putative alpha-1,2-mannosidase
MTKEEAQSHLAKLAPARSALRRMDGDDAKAVRERVESEWKALMAKMRESS